MLRDGFAFWTFVLATSTAVSSSVWSDEPVRPQTGAVKQRVSPKLLREALNLPEYQGQSAAVPVPVSLVDLQRLADKLKKDGDTDGSALLQRFIYEHEQLTKSSLNATGSDLKFKTEIKVIEVKLDGLAAESPLRPKNQIVTADEIRAELDRLVLAKKAKVISEPTPKKTQHKDGGTSQNAGELASLVPPASELVPSTGDALTAEFHECGSHFEIKMTPITKDRVRLDMLCHRVTAFGMAKRTIQCEAEGNSGEWAVFPDVPGTNGHELFVLVKTTPLN